MDIFIYGIPAQATNVELNAVLNPHLFKWGIHQFQCHKPKNKGYAYLHVNDLAQGQKFLTAYTTRTDVKLSHRHHLTFRLSNHQDGGAHLRDERFREQRVPPPQVPLDQAFSSEDSTRFSNMNVLTEVAIALTIGNNTNHVFKTTTLSCGAWDYQNSTPVFVSYYTEPRSGSGEFLVGKAAAVLLLYPRYNMGDWSQRIDFSWKSIDTVFTTGGAHPSLIISCLYSPKFYRQEDTSPTATPLRNGLRRQQRRRKVRIPKLDDKHGAAAACCFSYEIILSDNRALETIQRLLRDGSEFPPSMHLTIHTIKPKKSFEQQLTSLTDALSDDCQGKMPFQMRFQVLKLALNGRLPPCTVMPLIPILSALIQAGTSYLACAHALQQLYNQLPSMGPSSRAEEFEKEALEEKLKLFSSSYVDEGTVYRPVEKHRHLRLIHHVRVTPTGVYLEGPEQEVTNRVLRKYSDDLDCFVRVTFSDEDGERMEFQWNTSLDEVYVRIQAVLDSSLAICGQDYAFLGFSSSSLKSQTAWFMAPIYRRPRNFLFRNRSNRQQIKKGLVASQVIENLGDFSTFRSPAKCAARIGQAFTDTNGSVTVHAGAMARIKDVERSGRVFSDGCGTISKELANKVIRQYPRLQMKIKPVAFQIRFQGKSSSTVLSVTLMLNA
jgi:hypothetical protein